MAKALQAPFAVLLFVTAPACASSSSVSPSTATDNVPARHALSPALRMSDHILITHAVLAVFPWALFVPLGAIVLRLNIRSPWLFRIHAYTQMCWYLIYIVAVGLGIWLARESAKFKPTWTDPHVIIGLVILVAALVQPFLGLIHHALFKTHLVHWRAGLSIQRPGRTVSGRIHLWIGRTLITLGVINGGFGIRLASTSPFQDAATTKKAYIGYGVVAGLIWLLYAGVSALFEYRRTGRERRERQEDSYLTKQPAPTVVYRRVEEFKI